mgnify:CR=1 FL=1
MEVYNRFIEGLEHKNRIKNILNEDTSDKLLSSKVKKPSLNILLSTRPELKENINKIKMKYGYSDHLLEQEDLHNQISKLKNKYIKNHTKKYKINNVNNIEYINDSQNKNNNKNYPNKEFHKTHRVKSLDFGKLKNKYLPNESNDNNNNSSERGMSSQNINNTDNGNNISNISDEIDFDKKNRNHHRYLKNKKIDYNKIDLKIKEILKDEELSPDKVKKFSNIYPISKRINILTDVKKEINFINKNLNENNKYNNNDLSQLSSGSYTSIGFNYIKPRVNKKSIYEDFSYKNITKNINLHINKKSKTINIEKPVIIKPQDQPKISIMHFSSFCEKNKD